MTTTDQKKKEKDEVAKLTAMKLFLIAQVIVERRLSTVDIENALRDRFPTKFLKDMSINLTIIKNDLEVFNGE